MKTSKLDHIKIWQYKNLTINNKTWPYQNFTILLISVIYFPAYRETADNVVRGDDKFEKLMACAKEVATSAAQLTACSKVKADQDSDSLSQLLAACKTVMKSKDTIIDSANIVSRSEAESGKLIK